MKRLASLLLIFTMALTVIPTAHVHDNDCGYDPETGTGCVYEISLFENQWVGD